MMRIHSRLPPLLIVVIFLSGCSSGSEPNPTPSPIASPQSFFNLIPRPNSQQQEEASQDLVGRVVDMDGNPIQGATLESLKNTATSDQDGWFRHPSE
jgi:hypothetical protein